MADYPQRKRLRYKGYDYASYGSYFITICSYERQFTFGEIIDEKINLSNYGKIVNEDLETLIGHYDFVHIENFVVMPNHVHILINLISQDLKYLKQGIIPPKNTKSISHIIGAYKSGLTRRITAELENGIKKDIWQVSFHDRVVRNDHEYETFYRYIIANPSVWGNDVHNPIHPHYKKWEPK